MVHMLTEKELSVGLLVSHKKWGLGKVILLGSEDVWIYFKDIEGTPKECSSRASPGTAKS